MSTNTLQADLSMLIQESKKSKKKLSNLRSAALASRSELEDLPITSDTQLAADLARRPNFVEPFVHACYTGTARVAVIGVANIQRLVALGALPREHVKTILLALKETVNLSLEIQLKILQTLPSLFRHFADELNGRVLAETLEICATLQCSKTAAVSNTAAATLQQLVSSVFEKITWEDENPNSEQECSILSIEGREINVSLSSYDAFQIINDLCHLIEGEDLSYLRVNSLSKTFVLELIESILVNNSNVFALHPEHTHAIRHTLMPLTVRYMAERHPFPVTVRVARILQHIFKVHLRYLVPECEMILALLIHLIDTDTSLPWKRVLCMEIFRGLYSDPDMIRLIYALFDEDGNRKNILRDHMSCLARLALENPFLIGVSHQSTVPTAPRNDRSLLDDQLALESVGVAGIISNSYNKPDTVGISTSWSQVRILYIDILDKLDSPTPPETYIYSLVLNCIGAFSESMAKFIIPLTVNEPKSKRKRPVPAPELGTQQTEGQTLSTNPKRPSVPPNPLDFESHPDIDGIRAFAGILEACWPAILATSSTFLHAALDGEFYHNLVRAFQKLTHVAGLLRLTVPRDAFLTTLGKAAIPVDQQSPTITASSAGSSHIHPVRDHATQNTPVNLDAPKLPYDNKMSVRNLLCLRALLNLGIALGPTLDRGAWSIIIETLQYAELVLYAIKSTTTSIPAEQHEEVGTTPSSDVTGAGHGAEIGAVRAAANKLFESTRDYPGNAFIVFLTTLWTLSAFSDSTGPPSGILKEEATPPQTLQTGRFHHNKGSISTVLGRSRVQDDELKFILEKVHSVTKANISRFSLPQDGGIWDALVHNLANIIRNSRVPAPLRIHATEIVNLVVVQTIKSVELNEADIRNVVQLRALNSLRSQIPTKNDSHGYSTIASSPTSIEIHELALETLKSVLEGSGQSIIDGWNLVFELILGIFQNEPANNEDENLAIIPLPLAKYRSNSLTAKSPKLIRTAFDSVQLVASDFFPLLSGSCLLELVECFYNFASQKENFNISLTATAFFWNISDFLQAQMDHISSESELSIITPDEAIVSMAKNSDHTASKSALWLLLLLKMVDLTADSRLEVRNSAIQTILRILEHSGDQLHGIAWHLCLNRILFVMAEGVQGNTIQALQHSESNQEEQKAWEDTAILLTKGLSNLIATFFDAIIQHGQFSESWTRLFQFYEGLVKLGLLDLQSTVFCSFTQILSSIQSYNEIEPSLLQEAWYVWAHGNPVASPARAKDSDANQEALSAYFSSYRQLYRLLASHLRPDQVGEALENIQYAIQRSIHPKYSSDVEQPSNLQTQAIECIQCLCTDKLHSQPDIIDCLSNLYQLASGSCSTQSDPTEPTFIAFSQAAMQLLSWYLIEIGIQTEILSNHTLSNALEGLAAPILSKYLELGQGGRPPLWHRATTAALDILTVAIPYVESQYQTSQRPAVDRFWTSVVKILAGILSCGDYITLNLSPSAVLSDESFDITAFEKLRSLVIPSLGSPFVSDKIRRKFAFTLFCSSHIYAPHRLDLPCEYVESKPLADLYQIRRGRTQDPQLTIRAKLSYVLIDTLFNLVSVHLLKDEEKNEKRKTEPAAQYIALARAVSPYLLLRCALPLKSYIADQPLRGSMPQPIVSREELLYVLTRLLDLRSEPSAIPPAKAFGSISHSGPEIVKSSYNAGVDKGGDSSIKYKKHLDWMYFLVVRAIPVAGKGPQDSQVLDILTKILSHTGS
ncbi:hypothetical protein FQN57_003449 [Myotisia sp. PD_48]|nr:hypothetical protein FQN57_003449 [Myotisia sp. PD_48]